MSRLDQALQWLAGEISASPEEFRREFRQGADDLRDGLKAQGLAIHDKREDRYGVSRAGFKKLEAERG
ncbi:hypothetical protein MASR1M8_16000 [Thermomonas brevis]